ncbi:Signal-peptide peptidase, presenilin aspartyl protease [uncultured archaeon]|nr:Signal-peptide peptidase, presenilin aspartyl protease [uncultured archaeon]
MKHTAKITAIILAMFLLTQFIGLYVVSQYSPTKIVDGQITNSTNKVSLPYGMETPEVQQDIDFLTMLPSILLAFVIAILIIFLLTKTKADIILKIWFFIVVVLAMAISFNSVIGNKIPYAAWIALFVAIPLALLKIFQRNFFVHNVTELFIYPGVAAIFVPLLNIWTLLILLVAISIYDMWAVWHSGIMQKMAKYQMNQLKIFSGFFIPYIPRDIRMKLKKLSKSQLKKKRVKVSVAILGGGDVVFPIIAAGVMLKTLGFIPALITIAGAFVGLSCLLFLAEKKKFYPAMPFISAGILLAVILSYLIF